MGKSGRLPYVTSQGISQGIMPFCAPERENKANGWLQAGGQKKKETFSHSAALVPMKTIYHRNTA